MVCCDDKMFCFILDKTFSQVITDLKNKLFGKLHVLSIVCCARLRVSMTMPKTAWAIHICLLKPSR